MVKILAKLPDGYSLEQDSDALAPRRADGPLTAASGRGAAPEEASAGEDGVREEPAVPPAGLRASFFGRFELRCDGEEAVCLGRNSRALAILKRLLACLPRPVSQDHLMGWLWPEAEPKKARWSLNSAVYALRGLLGDCLPSLPASETVLLDGRGYRLSPHIGLSSDVEEFDLRCDSGYRFEEAGRIPEAVAEYQKAVQLYRGDYLVEDLYESWTMIERERLLDAYSDLLYRLAAQHLEVGQPREGVRVCYQLLTRDRCDEVAHRLLMRCFVNLGQRSRALRQYGLCERALGDDYGMAPTPETHALHASIRKSGGS